jgi:hypothetical protein
MPGFITRRRFAQALTATPGAFAFAQIPLPAPPGKPVAVKPRPAFNGPIQFEGAPVALKVRPFSLTQVKLLDGPMKQSGEWNRGYMSRLPVDRLLHCFRLTAGLPSPAQPLGGWESPKSELRGHFVGHYLSACGLASASTGDKELKARGDELVAGLARCQAKAGRRGYLGAYPEEFYERLDRREQVWAPFYTLHKIMAGLLDMYTFGGNREALGVVTRMAEWVDAWTAARTDAHMQDVLKTEFGGMGEILYNLSAATGENRWARAGDRFNKREFLAPLAANRDELMGLHANTHIPQVIAAARRFELSGDPSFRAAATFFYDTVVSGRTYSTGGSSNNELWQTEPRQLAVELRAASNHQECCCAYNMMKLTRQLYSWTGDPRYIDYYERNLLNHRLGAIQPETGHSLYFLSLTPGAWKPVCSEDRSFWCCTGSALEEYAKMADTIYYQDAQGVLVNLFVPSELDWPEQGMRMRQETAFPEEARTVVVMTAAPAKELALRIRVPSWLEAPPLVKLNGKPLEASAAPGSYFSLRRVWKEGDRLEMALSMALRMEATPDDAALQSILYGPLVLAGDMGSEGLTPERIQGKQAPEVSEIPLPAPVLSARGKDPSAWIRSGDGPLSFETRSSVGALRLRPLQYQWNRYAVYFEVA